MRTSRPGGLVAAVIVAILQGPAMAQIDATGSYVVGVVDPLLPLGACTADVVQTGSAIDFDFDCIGGNFLVGSGTIDPVTGAITAVSGTCDVSAPPPGTPGPFSAVGDAYGATFVLYTTCQGVDGTYFGTRCGNGVIDPGEDCEDGNFDDGDCCSSTCTAETGQVCDAATPECTVATCDASGMCVPGSTFESAGTSCDTDADLCATVEECDGAGSCLPVGGPLDCGLCATCDPAAGCVADWPDVTSHPIDPGDCRQGDKDRGVLSNQLAGDARDSLKWKLNKSRGFPVSDFGTPTSTTEYTLCVYGKGLGNDAAEVVLGELTIPSGAGWQVRPGGFRYQNDIPGVGTLKMDLRASPVDGKPKIKVKFRGPGLGYPEFIDESVGATTVRGVAIKLSADNGNCWASDLRVSRQSGQKGSREKIKLGCSSARRKCR